MKVSLIRIISVLVVLVLLGCVTSLKDYKAQTPSEERIKSALTKWQDYWNNNDKEGVLSVFHKDARIMIGGERKIVSKKEYGDYILERMKVSRISFGAPNINLKDNRAIAKFRFSTLQWSGLITVFLTEEDGRWFIMRTKF